MNQSAALTWTKDKPTRQGNYWVKNHNRGPMIVYIATGSHHKSYVMDCVSGPYSVEGWEWFAGPIPIPRDP